ncbi:MAG: glycosyltransferase family 4 protein [Tetrasphaera sp.]
MQIWLAPSAYFPARGGVEELTAQLARQYAGLGHEVTVVVHRHPASLPAREEWDGIHVARLEMNLPGRSARQLARYPLALGTQVRALDRLPRPDVVHVQCAANQLPALAAFTRLKSVPLVVTTQGEVTMDADQIYQRSVQMRAALRLGARRAAAVTACSRRAGDDAARVASRFAGCPVIPNGIDPQQWSVTPLPGAPVYAVWCRHVPQKGIDLLLDAFATVRERLPEAELLVGGEGSETPRLRARSGAGVHFLGPLDRAGVSALLERSRVVVVPSRLEPFGIVAVEAMACGRGVVWSTNGGLADATGGLGWGVNPNDRGALAGAMLAAHADPLDPHRARAQAETLAWSQIADRYERIYDRVRRSG